MKLFMLRLVVSLGISVLGLVVVGGFAVSPAQAAQTEVNVPNSIASDCSVDVSSDLNAWFATIPDDRLIRFAANGCYKIENSLFLKNRNKLTFDGNGSTFRADTTGASTTPPSSDLSLNYGFLWPRQRAHWLAESGSDLRFLNMTVQGPQTACTYVSAYEEQSGFHLNAVNGAVIERTTVRDIYGDFVSVQTLGQKILIQDNSFDCAARQGIAVVEGTDIVVRRNSLTRIGRSLFDVEPAVSTWQNRRISIHDNTAAGYLNTFLANLGQGQLVSDIALMNNTVTGGINGSKLIISSGTTSGTGRRNNYFIMDNTTEALEGSPIGVIRFTHLDSVFVARNRHQLQGQYPIGVANVYSGKAVTFDDVTNSVVRENLFPQYAGMVTTDPIIVLTETNGSTGNTTCGNIINNNELPPPVDGACVDSPTPLEVTNTNDSGAGSLRQALLNAQLRPGADTINFAIAGGADQTIQLGSDLPAIREPVTINACTQSGADCSVSNPATRIKLLGNGFSTAEGLSFLDGADASEVRGLAIGGFTYGGIVVRGGQNYTFSQLILGGNSGQGMLANRTGVVTLGDVSVILSQSLLQYNDLSGGCVLPVSGNYGTLAQSQNTFANNTGGDGVDEVGAYDFAQYPDCNVPLAFGGGPTDPGVTTGVAEGSLTLPQVGARTLVVGAAFLISLSVVIVRSLRRRKNMIA